MGLVVAPGPVARRSLHYICSTSWIVRRRGQRQIQAVEQDLLGFVRRRHATHGWFFSGPGVVAVGPSSGRIALGR